MTGSPSRPTPSALQVSDEVAEALATGAGVVACESTIISHGMPYPDNVAMARKVEQIIRDGGAVPATIAVLDGVPRIGLDDDQLDLLARDPHVLKASVRDLPLAVSQGLHAATTVAATARLAADAGIRVFVTGGLGGVHRGAELTWDVSADLYELTRTDIAVISAGVKSILDLRATLEVLETQGLPVIVYRHDQFPSFYSRDSGLPAPARLDTVEQLAELLRAKWTRLSSPGAVLIANPVPAPAEIPHEQIGRVIEQALADADRAGVTGKAVTPFLLGRIVELTEGASLRTNIALVEHNARLGAELARAWAQRHAD